MSFLLTLSEILSALNIITFMVHSCKMGPNMIVVSAYNRLWGHKGTDSKLVIFHYHKTNTGVQSVPKMVIEIPVISWILLRAQAF